MSASEQITLEDIERASERIIEVARHTPLERSRWLSREPEREVSLKLECFQTTVSE